MNAFEQFLLADSPKSGVGAETLEMLGRKAAGRFLQGGTSLNDSIRELVDEHPELQNEHVKRIVEFANNVAFQELFSKSDDKNIHFDVADPGVVIRDLKDGGSPAHDGKALDSSSKQMTKQDFADPESGMQHLQRMNNNEGQFGQGEQVEKVAIIGSIIASTGIGMATDKALNRQMKPHEQNLASQQQMKGVQPMAKAASIRERMAQYSLTKEAAGLFARAGQRVAGLARRVFSKAPAAAGAAEQVVTHAPKPALSTAEMVTRAHAGTPSATVLPFPKRPPNVPPPIPRDALLRTKGPSQDTLNALQDLKRSTHFSSEDARQAWNELPGPLSKYAQLLLEDLVKTAAAEDLRAEIVGIKNIIGDELFWKTAAVMFPDLEMLKKLSYEIEPEDRPDIPKKDFAQPNKEEEGHKGKYPVTDRQHAKSALGFAKMHGDTTALAAVKSKVRKKYPDMLEGGDEKKEKDSCMMGKCADWRLQGLEDDFVQQFLKEASPAAFEELNQLEHASPVENVYDLRTKLAAARTELARSHETFDLLVKEAREDLYQAIKREVMDYYGAGMNGVMHALQKVANDQNLAAVLMPMMPRLVAENVPADRLSITKTAAKAEIVNYDHPIIKAWSGLLKAAEDQTKAEIALAEVDGGLQQVNAFLQQAVR